MKVLISEKLNAINKNTKWLSDITEIPYPTLSRIVKGEDLKSIPVATFDKICTALNCGISDILSTEEDDIIKEKVKTENNKVIFEERLNILKSLNKIKTIVGTSHSEEYDQLALKLEKVFNETTFSNEQNDKLLLDLYFNPSIDDIINSYNIENISNTSTKKIDLFAGVGGFKDSFYKLNYSDIPREPLMDYVSWTKLLKETINSSKANKIKVINKENDN